MDRRPSVGRTSFFESSLDLRERTLATFLQAQPAERDPLIKHCFKGVLCRITNRATLLFTMLIRIDALSNQGTRLITASTRLFETYLRVTTQRHALLLTCPVVPEIPDLSPM